ncbi:MAG: hypothetical protein Q4B05_01500 [Candidatus Saccharibacteria bacterium]|nr:hypothetical protein [Candidatus Saccharibacteria bacterium]
MGKTQQPMSTTEAFNAIRKIRTDHDKSAGNEARDIMNRVVRQIARRGITACGIKPGEGGICHNNDWRELEGYARNRCNEEFLLALFNPNRPSRPAAIREMKLTEGWLADLLGDYGPFQDTLSHRPFMPKEVLESYQQYWGLEQVPARIYYPAMGARTLCAVLLDKIPDTAGKPVERVTGHMLLPVYAATATLGGPPEQPIPVSYAMLPLLKARRRLDSDTVEICSHYNGDPQESWSDWPLPPAFSEQYVIGQDKITGAKAFSEGGRLNIHAPAPLCAVTGMLEALRKQVVRVREAKANNPDAEAKAWDNAIAQYFKAAR